MEVWAHNNILSYLEAQKPKTLTPEWVSMAKVVQVNFILAFYVDIKQHMATP